MYVEAFRKEKRSAVLMDTSGSFNDLFGNASKLGIDLSSVEVVFISHWHGDHCGSLSHVLPLLRSSTPVYVPTESSSWIRRISEGGADPKVCFQPIEFMDGVMSTGRVGGGISEHSMVLNVMGKGLVVLAGCSHPGIVNIVKHAQQVSGAVKIYAVIGGLHISSVREGVYVAKSLREMGVELLSPCHCTHADAKRGIARVMGEKGYLRNGSGKTISIG